MSANEHCYVVFDIESSGLSPKAHRIVSIAASCRGKEFTALVNPQRPIPAAASAIHGLYDDDVKNAPTWKTTSKLFWEWVLKQKGATESLVLVAHNAAFDASFLKAENSRVHFEPDVPPKTFVVDTLRLCRARFPKLASHKQSLVYKHLFGAEPDAQHDSLGDVRALSRMIEHPEITRALANFRAALDPEKINGFCLPPLPPAVQDAVVPVNAPTLATSRQCPACSKWFSAHFDHACNV